MSVFLHRMGILSRNLIPEFIPTSLSGCALWLDAADANTLYDTTSGGSLVAANGAVARWEDKSGNGRHVTQDTSGSRSQRKVSVQNGRDVLRFDGDGDFLQGFHQLVSGNPAVTVFVVLKYVTITDNRAHRVLQFGASGGGSRNVIGVAIDAGYKSSFRFNGGAQVFSETTGGFHLARFSRAASDTIADGVLVLDGGGAQAIDSVNNGSETINLPSSGSELLIGTGRGSSGAIDGFADSDIAEIIVYNRALDATERRQVEEYLQAKWATPALPEI